MMIRRLPRSAHGIGPLWKFFVIDGGEFVAFGVPAVEMRELRAEDGGIEFGEAGVPCRCGFSGDGGNYRVACGDRPAVAEAAEILRWIE